MKLECWEVPVVYDTGPMTALVLEGMTLAADGRAGY
jgi:hypothetical protein